MGASQWINIRKKFFPQKVVRHRTVSLGNGHSSKAAGAPGVFRQCSLAQGETVVVSVQGQELDLILRGPCQLRIFWDSGIPWTFLPCLHYSKY